MKKQTYTAGENLEKFCADCKEVLDHLIKTVTKTGSISKVKCSKCGLLGTFKATANSAKIIALSTKKGEAYDQTRTYRTGQIMAHAAFGTGEVLTVIDTKKIEVLFADRVRRLVHSRS